ncbi:MAG: hypothetical protein ABL957_07330 [Parvularculaceae bacterium]
MSKRKRASSVAKRKRPLEGMPFAEAIERLAQTSPQELAEIEDEYEAKKRQASEIAEGAARMIKSAHSNIKRGARLGKKDFSL